MSKRNWLNVELTLDESVVFKKFLDFHHIKYESSECYNMIHIEVYVDEWESELCDNFLMNL